MAGRVRGLGAGGALGLVGRARECAVVDGVLDRARAGTAAVLAVTGDPGVGKSALLEYAVRRAAAGGLRVAQASGVESEMELAFAGLQQLCVPWLGSLGRLPGPQRAALETAFGLRVAGGVPPDPFFVGLGVLSLLSEVASAVPLLCVVDDVQWLDRASRRALGFVVRRLDADPVALLLGGRELGELAVAPTGVAGGSPGAGAAGGAGPGGRVEVLGLAGLAEADARALLAAVAPGWLDERLADRIITETQGNPLALRELPRGLTPAELAGGFGVLSAPGLPARIEESFRRRLAVLPAPTRRLLLLAAAEPTGDAALLWRACARAWVPAAAVVPAEEAGLVSVGARVRFLHPLVRSAIYRAAAADERQAAHRVLAAATDADADPDRRAWHRAEATVGPDEGVAAELEGSAARARARGGVAAAAAFLDRAAALTVEEERRAARALAAAQALYESGEFDRALELLALAETGPLEELAQAKAERLRAQITYTSEGGDGAPQLLRAAQRLQPLDWPLARAAYMEAQRAAFAAGTEFDINEIARALVELPAPEPDDPAGLLLLGYGLLFARGFPNGMDILTQAAGALAAAPFTGQEDIRTLELAHNVALATCDAAMLDVLTARTVRLARDAGVLALLPEALDNQAMYLARAGDLDAAANAFDEAAAIRTATGLEPSPTGVGALTVLRDEEVTVLRKLEELRQDPRVTGSLYEAPLLENHLAVLYNGLVRHAEALAAARRAVEMHPAGGTTRGLLELIEAAVRCGQPELARPALEALTRRTRIVGSDWGLGMEATARALLADGPAAEDLYREAIERLARTPMRLPLARARLLYGEWLRRERRRGEAREQLRAAHDAFDAMGARSFANRARAELAATGATAHSRRSKTLDELTSQEARVAQLAAEGLSNPEIAARMYISRGTVDYHLNKVFRKLGIRSRTQLSRALTTPPAARESY